MPVFRSKQQGIEDMAIDEDSVPSRTVMIMEMNSYANVFKFASPVPLRQR